jgi:hypothetical protein
MKGWEDLDLDEKFVLLVAFAADKTNRHGEGSFTVEDVIFAHDNFPEENFTEEGIEIQRELIVDGDIIESFKFLSGGTK